MTVYEQTNVNLGGLSCNLLSLIDRQVEATPDATALIFEGRTLTYQELNRRANQLANFLVKQGVRPETLVGLCVERSFEMVIGILGILKAGGAYVPVDPDYPADRIRFILEDSAAQIILTQNHLKARTSHFGAAILCMDSERELLEREPITAPDNSSHTPQDLIYVLYTSGSTGKPKGVMLTHDAIANHMHWMQQHYCINSEARILQKTPFSFDAAGWEFLVPLMIGARLVIARPGGHLDPDYLVDIIIRCGITDITFVPSMLNAFLEAESSHLCGSLKRVFCGGEQLSAATRDRFFAALPNCDLHNHYGPTEAAIDVTYWQCHRDDTASVVPIGWPIPNVTTRILDSQGKRVGINAPGELCLGGICLARGYLNRPELTAEKFIPDVYSSESGARLYRTGDLARWRTDGSIEYLGRLDFQVKLRGQRIELGEIEATILSQLVVKECVVVAREDQPGDQRLVAYVVCCSRTSNDSDLEEQLKETLRGRLPEYMVPAHILFLDRMPLSANGKLDRKALPAPDLSQLAMPSNNGPLTWTEEVLTKIWSEVLRVPAPGLHQNFFALGGHSLLAVQITSRMRAAFDVSIPIRALFTAPTISQLASEVDAIRRQAPEYDSRQDLHNELDTVSLSPAQVWLGYACMLHPESPQYNCPMLVHLEGELNPAALHISIQRMVERHESLRYAFSIDGGTLAVHLRDEMVVEMQVFDRNSISVSVDSLVEAEINRPFDLANDPLIRSALFRIDLTHHLLLLNLHHLVSDGWSEHVLIRELGASYSSASSGSADALPAVAVRYRDFASRMRCIQSSAEYAANMSYWNHQLSDVPVRLTIPTDYPRPIILSGKGAQISIHLPADLVTAVRELSRRSGVTPFMTLMAAWQALLFRHTSQNKFAVYSPFVGRDSEQTEGLVGYCANVLPVRAQVLGDDTVSTLLSRVRGTVFDALEFQNIGLAQLDNAPGVQTLFVLQPEMSDQVEFGGLQVQYQPLRTKTSKFELSLDLTENRNEITGYLEFSTDLFSHRTVERLADQFCTLLRSFVQHADLPISRINIVPEAVRDQLACWNSTEVALPDAKGIHELFEARAEETPYAIAVQCDEKSLTYYELNSAANRIAHLLILKGITPGGQIAICAERSIEMVTGILGIIKAGCAYIPLDPDHPVQRLKYIADNAGVAALISVSALSERVPDCLEPVILLDRDRGEIDALPNNNPGLQVPLDAAAYVMYTSGSTGQPKGVVYPHRGLINTLIWMQSVLNLNTDDRVLFKTPFGFDVSGWELFWPLISGASIVVAKPGGHLDVRYLIDTIEQYSISTVNFVPSMLNLFLEASDCGQCSTLRRVISAGEALTSSTRDQFFEKFKHAELHNIYGPTETNGITWFQCQPDDTDCRIPIGRPIANSQVWILDDAMQPVTIGSIGEIYLGGVNVASGYLNRDDLTAERFLPDPFSHVQNARLYRTGDLARWREDGCVEYLGRCDYQVKIRGQRIELGEIEVVLNGHEAVTETAVLAREDFPGDVRLVAYVTTEDNAVANDELELELQDAVRLRLPDYMVPSQFVFLERFPISANGKLDRKALPTPDRIADEGANLTAPVTETEKLIAGIWCDVLRLPCVGIDQDFFALGGHSLTALQVSLRLSKALRATVPMDALFSALTIRRLSADVDNLVTSGSGNVVDEEPIGHSAVAVMSPMQRWLGYACAQNPHSALYNIPIVLHLNGTLDKAALQAALQQIVNRHEPLRSNFVVEDDNLSLLINESVKVHLESTDLSDMDQREELADAAIRQEACRAFDLANEPLIRAKLWDMAPDCHILLVNVHHLVFDGWSEGVLLREVSAVYNAFVTGTPSSLPGLPIRYRNYAAWKREKQKSDAYAAQLCHWNEQLRGVPAQLELPTDRPRPQSVSPRGGQVPIAISPEMAHALNDVSRRRGVTLFMTLMAAWQSLLFRYSGQEDFVVYSPFAGRTDPQVDNLIGYFVNVLPIRASFNAGTTISALLHRVREICLDAFVNQDVSSEQIESAPRAQTLLVLQNTPVQSLNMQGVDVTRQSVQTETSKFELSVVLSENEDGIAGFIEFSSDLFEEATAARVGSHFLNLIAAFASGEDVPIAQLDMLSVAERDELVSWNETQTAYPRDMSITELFATQVSASPNAIALVCGNRESTYHELDGISNTLAAVITEQGIGFGDCVGVYMDRSIELVATILAILKVGAAYVPLDTGYPKDRVRKMVDTCGVKLIATRNFSSVGKIFPGICSITIESSDAYILNPRVSPQSTSINPELACYVMFTSGSTGEPRGVIIPHRGVVRLVKGSNCVTASPGDRFLLVSPTSFDASTLELWAPLLNGATLYIFEPQVPTLRELIDFVAENQISTLWVTSSLFQLIMLENPDGLSSVKTMYTGGDIVSPAAARAFLSANPSSVLLNGYGPTENTTFTTCHVLSSAEMVEEPVPIGVPISNTSVWILDSAQNLAPIGVPGELCAAGDGLSLGYINRPDLNDNLFVTFHSPHGPIRVYRTGDLARWRSDGVIEFLGRIDNQVKISGFRIEPGEIEAVLEGHPDVVQCAVQAETDATGLKCLVAWIASRADMTELEKELRSFVKQRLPEYCAPARYRIIEHLPQSPNGKLDRKALPALKARDIEIDGFTAARTEDEKKLSQIWANLLHVSTIGIDQDFFGLGGHSLMAIRMFARIDAEMGLKGNVSLLHQAPTVRELARMLRSNLHSSNKFINPVQPLGALPPLFCMYRLDGLDMCYRELAIALGQNQPVYGLRPHTASASDVPPTTIAEIAAECVRDIRDLYPDGPYLLAGSSFGGTIAYEAAQQLRAEGAEVALVAMFDTCGTGAWTARLPRPLPAKLLAHVKTLLALPPKERLAYIRNRIGHLDNPFGEDEDAAELRAEIKRLQDAHMKALWHYRPVAYAGRMITFKAAVRNPFRYDDDPTLWWGDLIAPEQIETTAGNHYTMLQAPHVMELADRLNRHIASALESVGYRT